MVYFEQKEAYFIMVHSVTREDTGYWVKYVFEINNGHFYYYKYVSSIDCMGIHWELFVII